MKKILPALTLLMFAACSSSKESAQFTSDPSPMISKTIIADDANALMDSLAELGIKVLSEQVGAWNLKALKIDCSAPVVPNPSAACVIETADGLFKATTEISKILYNILISNGAVVNTGVIGSSRAKAQNVACSRPVVPQAQSTCSMQVKAALPVDTKKEFSKDANAFIEALTLSGLTDEIGAMGAFNLFATLITCDAVIVPQAIPSCSIETKAKKLPIAAQEAQIIYQILLANGALVDSGLSGNSHLVALNLHCSRPVVLNPISTCSFFVAGSGN